MRRLLVLFLCFSLVHPAWATDLCQEVRLAVADAAKLPKETVKYTRYVSLYNYAGDRELTELHEKIALLFQLNSLSRERDLVLLYTQSSGRPEIVKIGPTLYRINLLYYGINPEVYENLHKSNPYFPCFEKVQIVPVVPAKAVVREVEQGQKVWVKRPNFVEIDAADVRDGEEVWEQGKDNVLRRITLPKQGPRPPPVAPVEIVDPAKVKLAAFLPAKELYDLAQITQSKVPLARADWLFYRTSQAVERTGDGYYDFLEIKHRDDAYKLAALDKKVVEKLRYDMAAMVAQSGVATNRNRQVWWLKTYIGSWWQTFDIDKKAVGKRNLLRLLGRAVDNVDFDHQAEEIYFHLPNRLWAVLACNNKGELQQTVPTEIAGDDTQTNNDKRIHVCLSCFRCHTEGLKPVDDWGKKAYREATDSKLKGSVALASNDYKELLRLRQLYLSDMPEQLREDQEAYIRTLKKLNGLTPKANAEGVRKVFQLYYDTPLDWKATARELGVKEEVWRKALTNYAARLKVERKILDPILGGLLAEESQPILRDQWEEVFSIAQMILKEASPP